MRFDPLTATLERPRPADVPMGAFAFDPLSGAIRWALGIDEFSPSDLFAAGEQGVWYDPSDWTTLFQDSAGTTPVTAIEQPVGLILDKSGRGNHASQPTTTSRPILRGRINMLVNTETLSTQSVTTRAAKHILSFYGTGSVACSGTSTQSLSGTGAGDRVYVEFTATAGTLTLTVSGSVAQAQLEEV